MTLNVTLIIQMIHFFIAYLLIDRLLLRSVVAVITQEDHQEQQRQTELSAERAKKDALLAEQKKLWAGYKKKFSALSPSVQEEPTPVASPQKIAIALDTKKIAQLSADCVQAVLSICSSVRS